MRSSFFNINETNLHKNDLAEQHLPIGYNKWQNEQIRNKKIYKKLLVLCFLMQTHD